MHEIYVWDLKLIDYHYQLIRRSLARYSLSGSHISCPWDLGIMKIFAYSHIEGKCSRWPATPKSYELISSERAFGIEGGECRCEHDDMTRSTPPRGVIWIYGRSSSNMNCFRSFCTQLSVNIPLFCCANDEGRMRKCNNSRFVTPYEQIDRTIVYRKMIGWELRNFC